ncbi:hypothetical protein [Paenibacillus harenae]|uniref:hypothetical protein n=1 Tax=Paenibacillus harenae TaxID=306543 RepID=UPI000419D501|nr:hypothetical protein [Paenibacillus harenae]
MKAIIYFFWNLMMGFKRVAIKLSDMVTASLVLIYSFEAHMFGHQRAAALPNRQKQHYMMLLPSVSIQKDSQNRPHMKRQIYSEYNKMLFRSSA